MNIIVLSYLPSIIGIGLLAAVIYLNNPKSRVNRTATLFSGIVFFWLIALLFADTATSDAGALWSLRAALVIGSMLGTAFIVFADTYPSEDLRTISPRIVQILWAITIIFMVLSVTDYMTPSVANSETESTLESITLAYALQSIFVLGQMFIGAYMTLRRRKKVSPQQRTQIQFFGYGMMVTVCASIIPNVLFIILNVASIWTPFLTSFSYFVFTLSVWFAITRHQLFHVRGVVARAVAYILSSFVIVTGYAFLVGQVIEDMVDTQSLRVLLTGMSFLLALVVFRQLTKLFNRMTNHLFYREAYDSQVALGNLTEALVSNIELSELVNASRNVLLQTLKPEFAEIVVYGSSKKLQNVVPRNIMSVAFAVFPMNFRVIPRKAVNVDTASARNEILMRSAGVQLLIPMHTAKNLEGCVVLGPRLSGEVYSRQDLDFLRIAVRNIGLALNNAKSFDQIASFNKTLRRKVDEATNELRTKNAQLEELHRTKDDFISMASHQLRPKITASQGFIDLLHASRIKMTTEQSELLGLVSQGIQRMSDIVVDMLDVSRMDSEQMVLTISKAPASIVDLVSSETQEVARQLGVPFERFSIKASLGRDAATKLDVLKIREVLQNLLSNACQYSPEGSTVDISVKGDAVSFEISVRDKGIGISKKDKQNVFKKFYRSEGAKKIRPTGNGIGLYAVKKIIDAHGGEVFVVSSQGKGSTFGFKLPIIQ